MPGVVTNDMIYEVLKSVRAQVAIVREDVTSMKARLTSPDLRLAQIYGEPPHFHQRGA